MNEPRRKQGIKPLSTDKVLLSVTSSASLEWSHKPPSIVQGDFCKGEGDSCHQKKLWYISHTNHILWYNSEHDKRYCWLLRCEM